MARELKLGSHVQVINDKDSGMLKGRKGIIKSFANDKIWIQFDNHRIPLPFDKDELKAVNRARNKNT